MNITMNSRVFRGGAYSIFFSALFLPVYVFANNDALSYPTGIGYNERSSTLYVAYPATATRQEGVIQAYALKEGVSDISGIPPSLTMSAPKGYSTKIISDNSTGFSYALYPGDKSIVVIDGSQVAGGTKDPHIIHIEDDGLFMLDLIPAEDGNRIFIAQAGIEPKIIVAGKAGDVLVSIPLDRHPLGFAYDKKHDALYVSYGEGFNVLTRISLSGDSYDIKNITTPYDVGALTVNESESFLVALDARGSHVMTLPLTGTKVLSLSLKAQAYFLQASGSFVYAGGYFAPELYRISPKEVDTIALSVHPVALADAGKKIAVLGHTGRIEVAGESGIEKTFSTNPFSYVFGTPQYFTSIVGSMSGMLFTVERDSDAVFALDANTGKQSELAGVAPLSDGVVHPVGSAFAGDYFFVANSGGTVEVFRGDNGSFVKTITAASSIDDIRGKDGTIYVVSSQDKKLIFINSEALTVSESVSLPSFSGGDDSIYSALHFIYDIGDSTKVSFFDDISGSWFVWDGESHAFETFGREPGIVRPPVSIGEDTLVSVNRITREVVVGGSTGFSVLAKRYKLPDAYVPLFAYGDEKNARVWVVALNSSGKEKVFIMSADGSIETSFEIGDGFNYLTSRLTNTFTMADPVLFAAYNAFDGNIWAFYPGRVVVYNEKGESVKTILSNASVLQLAVDGNKLLMIGSRRIDELNLEDGSVSQSWSFDDIPGHPVSVGLEVAKLSFIDGVGFGLTALHDSVVFYSFKDNMWHGIQGGVSLSQNKGKVQLNNTYVYIIVVVGLLISGLVLLKKKKANLTSQDVHITGM